jgi:hypothetical protein
MTGPSRELRCAGMLNFACVFLLALGCDLSAPNVQEAPEGYRIPKGVRLTLQLETP